MSSALEVLTSLGGVATLADLRRALTRGQIERALRDKELIRARRDRYVSGATANGLALAHELTAVLSHESAALHHGWPVRLEPERPHVLVRPKRRLQVKDSRLVAAHYRELSEAEVSHGVTTQVRTVLDCARDLPIVNGHVVADSAALRAGAVDHDDLRRAVRDLPPRARGRARALRVVDAATPRAANALESALRAEVMDLPGFTFEPQVQIADVGLFATVDLADRHREVALEAEGYAFHGGRQEFRRDCRRYDELVVHGWQVFRFAWEHVMLEPAFVRWSLQAWAARQEGRRIPRPPVCPPHLRWGTRGARTCWARLAPC